MINYGFNIKVGGNATATMKKLVALSKQLDTAFKKYSTSTVKSTDNIAKAMQRVSGVFSKQVNSMQKDLAKLDRSMSRINNRFVSINETLRQRPALSAALSGNVFGGFRSGVLGRLTAGFGAYELGRGVLNAGMSEEDMIARLTFALKDKDKAIAMNQQLTEFGRKAPIPIRSIREQAALLAPVFKDETMKYFRMLGDVVAGSGGDFGNIAYNFAQIKSMGRTYGIDLRQFAMQNIPIWEELAKVIGVTTDEVQLLSSSGKITFDIVEKAFENMTKEGGVYFEGAIAKANTFKGVWQIIANKLEDIFVKLFKKIRPLLKQFSDWVEKMIDSFDEWWPKVEVFGKMAIKIGVATAAFRVLNGVIQGCNSAIKILTSTSKLNPIILGLGSVVALMETVKNLRAQLFIGSGQVDEKANEYAGKYTPEQLQYEKTAAEGELAELEKIEKHVPGFLQGAFNKYYVSTGNRLDALNKAYKIKVPEIPKVSADKTEGTANTQEAEEWEKKMAKLREELRKELDKLNKTTSSGSFHGNGISGVSGKLVNFNITAPIVQINGDATDHKYTPEEMARIAADEFLLILKQVHVD